MTIKTYKANTNVSINVVLPSKKNLHITFVPLSDGSSVFTTSDEMLQKSIESHYKFGKLFKLYSAQGNSVSRVIANKPPKAAPSKKQQVESTGNEEEVNGEDANLDSQSQGNTEVAGLDEQPQDNTANGDLTIRKIKVSDIASAKDYLADTFGISRTSMRSSKAILEQAAAHGIEFEGLS